MNEFDIQPQEVLSWCLAVAVFIAGLSAISGFAGQILLRIYKFFFQNHHPTF